MIIKHSPTFVDGEKTGGDFYLQANGKSDKLPLRMATGRRSQRNDDA
jgi:hypothetical protein